MEFLNSATMNKVSVLLILVGFFFCILLPSAENLQVKRESVEESVKDSVANISEAALRNVLNQTRSRFISALKDLSNYLPINVNYTIGVGKECDIIHNNRHYYNRVPLIIAAVWIVLGVIFGFFGYRLIKIVLFLIGFLFGFSLTYFLIAGLTHGRPEHWIPYVGLAAGGLVGLLLGLLVICIYYIGIFLAGGSIGFLVVWFILSSIDIAFFRDRIYIPILIALAVAAIVGIIALLIQKWFFMFGTAILGAFIIVWGFDYYLELGSMMYYSLLFAENRSSLKPCWYSWCIIPLFFLLFVGGFLIQAFLTGRKYDHKKEMKGVCCGLCSKKKKKDEKDSPTGGPKYMKLKPITDDEK